LELGELLPKTDIGKMAMYSVIAFAAVYYAVPYAHEFAHAAVCKATGQEYELTIIFTGEARSVFCPDYLGNLTLLHVSGGLAGAATAAAIAFVPRRKILFIAAFPFVPQQLVNAGIETLAHSWYVSRQGVEVSTLLATAIIVSLFFALILAHRKKMMQAQRTQGSEHNQ
jgi:hypothetical protein